MRKANGVKVVATLITTTILAGCAADAGQKEQGGAIAGAVIGGVLGAAVSKGRNRGVGAVVGALAGGLLGGQIGRYFDAQDRKRIAELSNQVLIDGSEQTYVSPKTRARVTITASEPELEEGPSLEVLPTVYAPADLRLESRSVFVARDMVVRASPSPAAPITGKLARGEKIEIAAVVPESAYRLVSRDGVGIGYATEASFTSSLNTSSPAKTIAAQKVAVNSPSNAATSQKPVPTVPSRPGASASPRDPEIARVASLTSKPGPASGKNTPKQASSSSETKNVGSTQTVTLNKECKVVTLDIVLPNGQRSKGAQRSCYEPPSGWQTVAV